jgi:hypothetical protein
MDGKKKKGAATLKKKKELLSQSLQRQCNHASGEYAWMQKEKKGATGAYSSTDANLKKKLRGATQQRHLKRGHATSV